MQGLLLAVTNVINFQAGVTHLYHLIELVESLLSVFGGLKKGANQIAIKSKREQGRYK